MAAQTCICGFKGASVGKSAIECFLYVILSLLPALCCKNGIEGAMPMRHPSQSDDLFHWPGAVQENNS